MRKSFTLLFIVLLCAYSFAYTVLQKSPPNSGGGVLVLPLQLDPEPPSYGCDPKIQSCCQPCFYIPDKPDVPYMCSFCDAPSTPIHNIIIPFLLVNVVFLTIYIVKKNKRLKKIRRARRISRIRKRLAKH